MHERQVLITGITGFIGSHLVEYLNRYYPSCKITGISRNKPNISRPYDVYAVNLLNQDEIINVVEEVRPDYIFHLAGLVFSYDWDALYCSNVLSTANLLDGIKKTNVSTHVVIAGSAAEYGAIPITDLPVSETSPTMPLSPYGATKLWQTLVSKYEMSADITVNVGRIFNVIGLGVAPQLSSGNIFYQFGRIMQGKQKPELFVGDLSIKRDFLDIADVCSGLVALAMKGHQGEVYNICSSRSVSLNNIVELLLSETKLNIDIINDDHIKQNAYVNDIYGCNAKIKQDTGWNPIVSLNESIKKMLSLYCIDLEEESLLL